MAGANTVKSKSNDFETDLIRKINQMNALFKVGEYIKFLG